MLCLQMLLVGVAAGIAVADAGNSRCVLRGSSRVDVATVQRACNVVAEDPTVVAVFMCSVVTTGSKRSAVVTIPISMAIITSGLATCGIRGGRSRSLVSSGGAYWCLRGDFVSARGRVSRRRGRFVSTTTTTAGGVVIAVAASTTVVTTRATITTPSDVAVTRQASAGDVTAAAATTTAAAAKALITDVITIVEVATTSTAIANRGGRCAGRVRVLLDGRHASFGSRRHHLTPPLVPLAPSPAHDAAVPPRVFTQPLGRVCDRNLRALLPHRRKMLLQPLHHGAGALNQAVGIAELAGGVESGWWINTQTKSQQASHRINQPHFPPPPLLHNSSSAAAAAAAAEVTAGESSHQPTILPTTTTTKQQQ
jgi:hypothetical protein